MHVIIPVAGEGTRLRPHTFSVPKVLLPVAGKPILDYILDEVGKLSPDRVTLIIGHLGDQIRAHLEASFDLPFHWVVQENRRGLGHAVGMGIEEGEKEPLLIILGDTIFEADLTELGESPTSAIGVREVEDPRRFGVVELEGDRVVKLVEKPDQPRSNLAIVGLYYLTDAHTLKTAIDRLVEDDITTRGEYQLTDALALMVEDGEKITTFRIEGWYDCGKPETLLSTNAHFLSKRADHIRPEDSVIVEPVYIHPDARISRSVVGPDVSISAEARIDRSIVTNSIICDSAEIRHMILDGSIVGPGAFMEGTPSQLNIGTEASMRVGRQNSQP